MALTLSQKSNLRRHLKYGIAGLATTSPAGGNLAPGFNGYRFFQGYGAMEYRMNNLAPDEEARIVGAAYGAAAIVGPAPHNGDTVSVVLSGGQIASPQTLVATAGPAANPTSQILDLVMQLAAACAGNTVLQAAGVRGVAPYGTGPFAQNAVPVPEVAFSAPKAFTITAAGSGILVPQITADGSMLPPFCSLDGDTTTWGYLPILDGLEAGWLGAAQNLDTIQADVWKGRNNEAGARKSLYETYVQQLADFIGIWTNRDAKQRPAQTTAVRYA